MISSCPPPLCLFLKHLLSAFAIELNSHCTRITRYTISDLLGLWSWWFLILQLSSSFLSLKLMVRLPFHFSSYWLTKSFSIKQGTLLSICVKQTIPIPWKLCSKTSGKNFSYLHRWLPIHYYSLCATHQIISWLI